MLLTGMLPAVGLWTFMQYVSSLPAATFGSPVIPPTSEQIKGGFLCLIYAVLVAYVAALPICLLLREPIEVVANGSAKCLQVVARILPAERRLEGL